MAVPPMDRCAFLSETASGNMSRNREKFFWEANKKPCPIRKSRAKGLTLLAKVCIIKIKKAPSIDGCPRIVEK